MNKIIVEVSIGELLDKISILEIKQEKIKDPEKLRFISNEHSILKKQLLAVFETECIGFVTAWEYAERYTKSIGRDNPENDRFLVIIQALTIWINAKNLGVACGEEIPDSIRSYIAILREYFGIEVEHLLK